MAIAEVEAYSIQEFEPQTPKTELEQFLDGITPPQPSPDDDRDPIEAQIYNLLGDITLPRSFLPGARAIATEQNQISAEAIRLGLITNPDNHHNRKLVRSGEPYPGLSPEVDQILIEEKTKKRFKELIQHKPIIALRDEAQELYERYIKSRMKNHSTTEAYFMRKSFDIWERMSTTAKDFLLYGDHRWIHIDLDNEDGENGEQVIKRVLHEVDGFLRVGKPNGSVFIDTDETKASWWDQNEIGFKFSNGNIDTLSIDDYVEADHASVLIAFIKSLSADETTKIVNSYNTGSKVGPFDVFFREHDWADFQYGISISTKDWSRDEIIDFLQKYITFIKTAKRTAPEEQGSKNATSEDQQT